MTTYAVAMQTKKEIKAVIVEGIEEARKEAIKMRPPVDTPVTIMPVGKWVGKVGYYPGEGYVWCERSKDGYIYDYYPIRSNGSLGKKHPF